MPTKTFSIKEAFTWGFNAIIKNIGLVIALVFISLALPILRTAVAWHAHQYMEAGEVPRHILISFASISVLNWLVTTLVLVAFLRLALRFYNKQPITFASLFTRPITYGYLIIAQILYSLITFGGLLLLIVPGIMWAIIYSFTDIIVVNDQCGPIEALKKSSKLTKGYRWKLFAFYLLVLVFAFIVMFSIIGIPLVLPIISAARVHIFKKLQEQKQSGTDDYVPPVMTS